MIFIDANVFLAYFNGDDIHHHKAMRLWETIEAGMYGPKFTSDYVFNEVVGVALRKFGKRRAIVLGKHILESIFVVNLDEHIFNVSWKAFSYSATDFGLVDWTSVVIMKFANVENIATFDKGFDDVKGINIVN